MLVNVDSEGFELMANQIPFTDKLRKRVGAVLEDAGFELTSSSDEPFELVTYERKDIGDVRRDKVSFYGSEEGDNFIFADAVSGKSEFGLLTTIKLLMPNFETLHFPETNRWQYISAEELDLVVDEIQILVQQRLLLWFEQPDLELVQNVSKVDVEKWREHLANAADLYESLAEKRSAEGKSSEAERFKRTARLYRDYLSR